MSGRIKGIILNLLIPGVGFMAQSRWGWGFLYLIIALILLVPTATIGYFVMGLVAAFHSGAIGDASRELSQKDIEKIAVASAIAKKKMEEITPTKPENDTTKEQ
jgi:hypothetical protein